jgi:very-short-patch-repair endonuclease
MARAAGITDRQLQHPEVERLSRDTYLPRALSGDLRQRLAAVLLTAPAGAVLSHATAASLWGVAIPLQPIDDRRVDLIVPAGSRAESRVDRRVHRIPVGSDEVTRHGHFSVTVPERTWRDLAARLRPPALLAVTDQLLAHGCTVGELQRQLDRRPSGRGSARARAVLPVADRRAESPMESVLRWLLHVAGLPAPDLQFAVRSAGGVLVGRADLAWPDRKVLVEFDGNVHRERAVFVNDVRRQNALVAAGWTVLRFTSADVLGRPDEVVAEIRRALRARDRRTRTP